MSERAEGALVHAGFVSRLAAFVIDIVVLLGIGSATTLVVESVHALLRPRARIDIEALLAAAAPLVWLVCLAYFVVLWALTGQTLGKWLLGLRVVTVQGGALSLSRALVRVAGYLLSALPLYLGFFWVVLDSERRALHDRLARTVVVYDPPRRAPARHAAPPPPWPAR